MARLEVEIIGDSRSLERAFARSEKSAKGFDQSISKTGQTGKRAFGGLSKAAGLFGVGIGATAVVGGLKSSIDAASNLNEEIAKTNVVFGKSGQALIKWSETTASTLGISERAALEATGTFGNMLVPMGVARDKAAGMSKSMVSLAGDMSSFNNASPEDTLEAIRSGLAGEAEPLRKFGVFLNQDRIEAQALSSGLVKANVDMVKVKKANLDLSKATREHTEAVRKFGPQSRQAQESLLAMEIAQQKLTKSLAGGKVKLDAQQKAIATYQLILKDTKDAQGDAAKTGGNWAGVQRRLGAVLENLAAKIGQILLPTLEKLGNQLVKWLSNTKNQQTVMTTLKSTVAAVTGVVNAMRTAFGVLTKVTGSTTNAIKLLIAAFVIFKAMKLAGTVMGVARSVGILGTTSATSAGKVGVLNTTMGKAGLAGAALLAGYELSNLIRKIPGWDTAMKGFGSTLGDVAEKAGLIHDPGEQFKGKTVLTGAQSRTIRQQAARLEARGMTPQQAATRIAAQHPNVARRDIGVLAGEYGTQRPIVLHNIIELDGTVVTRTVNRHNARGAHRTAQQTSGLRG